MRFTSTKYKFCNLTPNTWDRITCFQKARFSTYMIRTFYHLYSRIVRNLFHALRQWHAHDLFLASSTKAHSIYAWTFCSQVRFSKHNLHINCQYWPIYFDAVSYYQHPYRTAWHLYVPEHCSQQLKKKQDLWQLDKSVSMFVVFDLF